MTLNAKTRGSENLGPVLPCQVILIFVARLHPKCPFVDIQENNKFWGGPINNLLQSTSKTELN